jgi:hypothetical protein
MWCSGGTIEAGPARETPEDEVTFQLALQQSRCSRRRDVEIGGYSVVSSGYFVGWGTLALINAGIAQGKNRSGLAWFLLSLLLGPIATFVLVAFMSKLPSAPPA